ncbi:MAG: efflux RND transporter permease subunit [Gemmatimonadetes bacterium]|nr:efflux RND transporter permease subunit [Gemmatimonadota bacterium]MYK67250.1 efflux RND transporter permease subunit [Gemmatimonadota bacterium]
MDTRRAASGDLRPREKRGPVAYMARNGVAANLLMFFILAAGFFALRGLVQEVFPEVSLDRIRVTVPYPGATPDEVEESIILKIEEQLEGVDGVKRVRSTAAEGRGSVVVELNLGEDLSRALDDVKAQIDRIQTFPAGAERPEVTEVTSRQSVIRIALYGDVSERSLKEVAYRTEDALADLPEVSYVETTGVREYEISIEVPLDHLRSLGLTLQDVSNTVRGSSLDLSAGSIDTRDEEVRIRTTGQNYTQQDFEDIIVLSRADGTVVRLGDIAEVRDGFRDVDLINLYEGQPAAYVEVFRTADEKVLRIVDAVEKHLDEEVIPSLPAGVHLAIWNNDADILKSRLGLLVKNGLIGLTLVLLALALFLETRLAFWVAVGIAVSFVGTFAVMSALDVSINLMSLFAFILAVGIVVDDAIVVGENIYAEREKGLRGVSASIRGTRRITTPVTFAVLTTGVAFCPLFFIPSSMGRIIGEIPIIVISVLLFSLIESLLVLPNHLSHLPRPGRRAGGKEEEAPSAGVGRHPGGRGRVHPVKRIQMRVDGALKRFIAGPLDRSLRFATGRPGIVIAAGVGMIIVCVAMIPAGIIRVTFMPTVEGDLVTANLEMPEGTPVQRTTNMALILERAGYRVLEQLAADEGQELDDLVEGVNVTIGQEARQSGPAGDAGAASTPRAAVASVEFKLVTADQRDVSAVEFQIAWRRLLGPLPRAKSISINSDILRLGDPVHVELAHPDPQRLAVIADTVMARLQEFDGVYDIQADQEEGLREIQLDLRPEARTLGLTLDNVARQVRAAFFGDEALRVQRGREDVRVYVRLPGEERNAIADVEGYMVRTPAGRVVPLGRVAEVRFGNSPTTIQRKDGDRVVTVTADVVRAIVTGPEMNSVLESSILPELVMQNPGLNFSFGGERQEQVESFGALGGGFALAMLAIYALLAIPFGSYTKPLIIMAAIPFGIIGAVLGHLILGLNVAIMSLFGIVGLSGVVVNDSLVMIDFINERLRQGMSGREAIIAGAKARFRPIFLTSVTTFLGVAPLVFETSLQAQFLIPMAASLGFGILFGTGVLMMIVPALAMVHHRVVGMRGAGTAKQV